MDQTFNKEAPNSNVILSPNYSRGVLKEINSNEDKLSQISNKPPAMPETKLTVPSSQPQIKVTGPTPNASPSPTAGSAGYEANPPFSPPTEQKICNSPTSSIRPVGGTSKSSNKFIGLTEFDESQIPELPDCLNPNFEEHLKTTFEDDFIPTLTVLNTTENIDTKNSFPSKESLLKDEINSSDSEAYNEYEAIEAEFQKLKKLAAAELLNNSPTKNTLNEIESAFNRSTNEAREKETWNLNATNPSEAMDIDFNLTNNLSPNNCSDIEQENLEKSLNKTIEMPRKLNNSLTQESNITIDEVAELPEFTSDSAIGMVTEAIKRPILNLTLDMSTSFCSAKSSAPSSPAFPIANINEPYRFPQSPISVNQEITFLEKSDYAKKFDDSNKFNSENNDLNTLDPPLAFNSNHTSSISTAGDNGTTMENSSAQGKTFTASSLDTNAEFSNSNNGNRPQNDLNTIIDKSTTISVSNDCTQANNIVEDMDVDISMASLHENDLPEVYLTPKEELNLNTDKCEKASTPVSNEQNQLFSSNDIERESSKTPPILIPQSHQNIVVPESDSPFYQLFSPIVTMEERQNKEELMGKPKNTNLPNIITMAERHKMNKDVSLENQKSPLEINVDRSAERAGSPPISTIQKQLQEEDIKMFTEYSLPPSTSPPIPTLQKQYKPNNIDIVSESIEYPISSTSPPIPTLQNQLKTEYIEDLPNISPPSSASPPIPSLNKPHSDLSEEDNTEYTSSFKHSINKRAAIHGIIDSNTALEDVLSAKEQTKSNARDEKDIENIKTSEINDLFMKKTFVQPQSVYDEEFKSITNDPNELFDAAAFDYLLSKGNNTVQENRSSLLLKFDPLLGAPVAITNQQIISTLSPTIEEEENCGEEPILPSAAKCAKVKPKEGSINKNETMSITMTKDIHVENDCKKSYDNSNSQSDVKQNDYQMDELEKKIKNEVLKTEDIEKKLKDAESREENYIKRITEKDKAIYKMHSVIEAYEKAIAELISEKEQIVQSYEKQLLEIKSDRDSNYQHLTSLETTFSDLHVKYEKSKEMTLQLKKSEEVLLNEKAAHLENIRLQEKRYEKMKLHAMQQLEFANNKLELMSKEHHIEAAKLKASLKKEELARASLSEQLQQKARENNELVKICDELINGQGS